MTPDPAAIKGTLALLWDARLGISAAAPFRA
jgi:hypothetical protein